MGAGLPAMVSARTPRASRSHALSLTFVREFKLAPTGVCTGFKSQVGGQDSSLLMLTSLIPLNHDGRKILDRTPLKPFGRGLVPDNSGSTD